MNRYLATIPIAVGSVAGLTIGTLLFVSGLHGLLATSAILRND